MKLILNPPPGGEDGNLMCTKNFSFEEFKCPCCGQGGVKLELLYALQRVRDCLKPDDVMEITSGYRCPIYNSSPRIGSNDTSSHVKGLAADIKIDSSGKAFRIMEAIMKTDAFKRVGFGKMGETLVLHVDIDSNKVQNVLWGY